ncbi:hypothetical protein LTS10_009159 [Elasticomyces elasticus]|nr:hypothetical protein LTS10_009159 [Elasticomyces elasticus]
MFSVREEHKYLITDVLAVLESGPEAQIAVQNMVVQSQHVKNSIMRLSVLLDPATLMVYLDGARAFQDEVNRASLSTVDSDRFRVSGGSTFSFTSSQIDSRHTSFGSTNSAANGWPTSVPDHGTLGRDLAIEPAGQVEAAMSGGHDSWNQVPEVNTTQFYNFENPYPAITGHNSNRMTTFSFPVDHEIQLNEPRHEVHRADDPYLPTHMQQTSLIPLEHGPQYAASPAGSQVARQKDQKEQKAYWCPEPRCDIGHSRAHGLRRHLLTRHIVWRCDLCPKIKAGPGEKEMATHLESKHAHTTPRTYGVADRRYFGCPFCDVRLEGFSQYLEHTLTQHKSLGTCPEKSESKRLYGLLFGDAALCFALDQEALQRDIIWRGIASQPNDIATLITDLESGWPYATDDNRIRLVQKWLGYLVPLMATSVHGSFMDL